MSDALDLDALKALCAAATEGPWAIAGWNECNVLPKLWAEDRLPPEDRGPFAIIHTDGSKPNARFIAAARTAVPALIAEVERLRLSVPQDGQQ